MKYEPVYQIHVLTNYTVNPHISIHAYLFYNHTHIHTISRISLDRISNTNISDTRSLICLNQVYSNNYVSANQLFYAASEELIIMWAA